MSRASRTLGFIVTGPGFYVWEESRMEALRAARELGAQAPAATAAAKQEPRPARSGRSRRRAHAKT
jgi:hypothetical protein